LIFHGNILSVRVAIVSIFNPSEFGVVADYARIHANSSLYIGWVIHVEMNESDAFAEGSPHVGERNAGLLGVRRL
jgi:hypothetical protein